MRTAIKIAVGIVLAAALLACAVFLLVARLDFNAFRGTIADLVRDETGRELTISGQIRPSFGWAPTVAVDDVTLSNAAWADPRPMLDVKSFEVQLQLWPLLTSVGKTFVIDRVVAQGAAVFLQTDRSGRANWQFDEQEKTAKAAASRAREGGEAPVKKAPSPAGQPATGAAGEEVGGAAASPVDFEVRAVDLTDVTVTFQAAGSPARVLTFDKFALRAAADGQERKLEGKGSYQKLAFSVDGELGGAARGGRGEFPLDVALRLGDRASLSVAGKLRTPAGSDGYELEVAAEVRRLGVIAQIADEAGLPPVQLPASLGPLGPLRAQFAVKGSGGDAKPSCPSVRLALDGPDSLRLKLEGAVRDPLALFRSPRAAAGVDLKLSGEGSELAVLSGTGPGAGSAMSGPFKIAARLADRGPNAVTLTGVDVQAADTELKGEVTVSFAAKPSIDATLHADRIELAKLGGGGGGAQSAESDSAKGTRVFSDAPLPLEAMDAIDAAWKLSAGALVLSDGMELLGVDAGIVLKNGSLAIEPLRFGVGGGSVDARATLSDQGALSAKIEARAIDLGTVLRQTRGMTQLSGGHTDADVDVRGTGRSVRQLMAGLSGSVFVHVAGGSIRSTYLGALGLGQLMALINKSLVPEENVRLNCVVSQTDIAAGMARHRTLVVDTTRLSLVGRGHTNLATEALDIRVATRPKDPSLLSVLPPIRIKGSIGDPRFEADVAGAAAGVAGAIVDAPGTVVGTAGDVAGSLLGALIGRPYRSGEGDRICEAALAAARGAAAGGAPAARSGANPPQPSGGTSGPGGFHIPTLPNPFRR